MGPRIVNAAGMKRGTAGMKTACYATKAAHAGNAGILSPPVNAPPSPRDFAANAAPGSIVANGVAQIARTCWIACWPASTGRRPPRPGLLPPAAVLGDASYLRATYAG